MIKLERTSVMNLDTAIRGARNPLNSWNRSDSFYDAQGAFVLGANDLDLAHRLAVSSDFSCERMSDGALACLDNVIAYLESARLLYNETKDKTHWHDMIQLLPASYNQMRTCTMNYENLINIYYARRNHKLQEWHVFCDWVENLPYAQQLILVKKDTAAEK